MDLKAEILEDIDQLPQDTLEAFNQGKPANFCMTREWWRLLSRYGLDPGTRLRLHLVSDLHGARGVMALCQPEGWHWNTGRRLEALASYYTALYAPLLASENDQEALEALVRSVVHGGTVFDRLDLYPLDRDHPVFARLVETLRKSGLRVQAYFRFGNWYLKVQGRSWEAYQPSLPSQLRNTLRRKSKQFLSGGGTLEIVSHLDQVEGAIQAYQQVYGSSWKQAEPHPEFMPELIRMAARMGWLRLGVARLEEKPIAAQVWIVCEGMASIYKLAYDERYAKLSAGSILTAHLMAHVLDVDRVHEVDYLTGDDAYKKDWMSHRRERWGLVAFNGRTWHGALQGMAHLGWQAVRAWTHKRGGSA